MTWTGKQNRSIDKLPIYEIRLQGRLDKDWSDWLEGMSITHEEDITILRGQVIDQAALQGILIKLWDLNRKVISVNQVGNL